MSTKLTKAEVKELVFDEIEAYKREGIKFAIAGNAGYGKTTTLNELFGLQMKTDATQTATTKVHELSMLLLEVPNAQENNSIVNDIPLTVFDLPGLGDGEDNNQNTEKYFEIYTQLLPNVDVVLWIIRADVRMFKLEVEYISRLVGYCPELKDKIVIGINYSDSIAPKNWNHKINNPSSEQIQNLELFTNRVYELIHDQCGIENNIVVAYSAERAWKLETLFYKLIQATPEEKRWMFGDLKLDYREAFLQRIPPKYRSEVEKIYVPI